MKCRKLPPICFGKRYSSFLSAEVPSNTSKKIQLRQQLVHEKRGHYARTKCLNTRTDTYCKQLGMMKLPEHVSVNEFPARLSAASSAVASLLCFKMSPCRVREGPSNTSTDQAAPAAGSRRNTTSNKESSLSAESISLSCCPLFPTNGTSIFTWSNVVMLKFSLATRFIQIRPFMIPWFAVHQNRSRCRSCVPKRPKTRQAESLRAWRARCTSQT